MQLPELLEQAPRHTWTGIYLRFLACVLALGAVAHIGNMAGWSGIRWTDTPALWRTMDVVLLLFNVVVGVALWLRQPWSIAAYVAGIVALQLVPYTLFRSHFFQTPEQELALNSLVVTHLILMALLVVLIVARK